MRHTNDIVQELLFQLKKGHLIKLLEVKLSYEPVCPAVGRSFGWSVGLSYFLKEREVSFPWPYRITCLYVVFLANIAFPLEDNGVFDEIVFTELQREEAQAVLEGYNKVSIGGWGSPGEVQHW